MMRCININDYVRLPDGVVDWFDKNMFEIKSQIRPDLERGLLLYYLCKKYNVKNALDVGTAGFFTAKSMAKAGAKVTTIDIKGEMPDIPYENITFIKGDSKEVLPEFIKQGNKYDIIFIDGDHSYAGVKQDLINAKQLSNLIVCHDYGNLADVTRAIDEEIEIDKSELILADRMWRGAPYEKGYDKNGNKIDYGIIVYQQ